MLPISLNEVDEAYLQALCAERRPESQRLDFKRLLPHANDPQWREEFAKDVCSFANAEGGDLVYGVRDQGALAEALEPIAAEGHDAAMRRLGQVANALIQPRIVGLRFHHAQVAGGYVLILRVPQSFGGPHGYTTNNGSAWRFPIRVMTHTADMSYEQLRIGFDRTATLRERVREIRSQCVQRIVENKTWRPMQQGPRLAVQFIPLQSAMRSDLVDVGTLFNGNFTKFMFPNWGGGSRTLHLDGLAVHPGSYRDNEVLVYVQIYRSGVFELVHAIGRLYEGNHLIPAAGAASLVREAAQRFLQNARELGLGGPAIFGVSLTGVDQYRFAHGNWGGMAQADRPNMIIPEIWIERIEAIESPEVVWRPAVDFLWQCFGLERCDAFDGERLARQ